MSSWFDSSRQSMWATIEPIHLKNRALKKWWWWEQTEKLYSGRLETSAVGIIQTLLVKQDTLQTLKEHSRVKLIICTICWSRTVVKLEVQISTNHLPTLVEYCCLMIQDDWTSISALKCYWECWHWSTWTNLICDVSKDNKFVPW